MYTIYQITNETNRKRYVGITTRYDLSRRISEHFSDARRGEPRHLCRAITKYGENNFTVKVLEVGENQEFGLKVAEPMYIAWLQPEYNKTYGGEGTLGYHHTGETKQILSEKNKGNQHSLGNRHSEKTKLRQSISKLGNTNGLGIKHPTRSNESRQRYSVIQKDIPKGPQIRVSCSHCQKVGGVSGMKRYHFDNCKNR